MMANRYAPIEDYGIIGDLHTIALVGKNGSIDFLCLPSFDSPSVFAALLDADRGGRFQIAPQLEDAVHRQLYLPDTNVLLTRFLSDSGVAEVSDFMPVEDAGVAHNLVRRAKTVRGEIRFAMRCDPRFDYAPARASWCCGCARRSRCSSRREPHWPSSRSAPTNRRGSSSRW
jgi:GH15 family glucan-1,4-alpha-glucosidase